MIRQRYVTHGFALFLGLLSLGLAGAHLACAPQHVSAPATPPAPLTLTVWPPTVWLGAYDAAAMANYPVQAEVIARVQDEQGRPVEGAVVAFALEPDWAQGAVLSPSEVKTHHGVARTTFSAPKTTGRVRLTARTDHRTATAVILVDSYEERLERD
jgi:hypothetical protein